MMKMLKILGATELIKALSTPLAIGIRTGGVYIISFEVLQEIPAVADANGKRRLKGKLNETTRLKGLAFYYYFFFFSKFRIVEF